MTTVVQLREKAKTKGIKQYYKLKKEELCNALGMTKYECFGAKFVPPKLGKKLKLRKAECVGDTVEWIVGKGCFEKPKSPVEKKEAKPKSPSPPVEKTCEKIHSTVRHLQWKYHR